MNTAKAPFNDLRVRQAFRLIANRDDLVKRALAGQDELQMTFIRLVILYMTTVLRSASKI